MKHSRTNHGFSLLELCIAVLIIAVLALFSFSVFTSTKEKSRVIGCIANLRLWGSVIAAYTSDHAGELPMNQVPHATGTGKIIFFQNLASYGSYRFPITNTAMNRIAYKRSILACPAEPTLDKGVPYTYGLNIDLDYTVQGEKARVRVQTLRNSSTYVLMSDTLGTSTFYTHTRKKFEDYSKCHMRHGGAPNFLYADGHVSPLHEPMVGWGDPGGNTEENRNIWFANGINPTRR